MGDIFKGKADTEPQYKKIKYKDEEQRVEHTADAYEMEDGNLMTRGGVIVEKDKIIEVND